MFVFVTIVKLILDKWVRILLFVIISAALIFSFGILGNHILYSDKVTDPISVIIVDCDNSTESRMFTQMFYDYELYKGILNFYEDSEEAARLTLARNEAAAILILPENFAENIKNGSNEPFIVVLNEAQLLKKTLIEYFALSFADILAGSQSGVYAALDFTYQNYPESYGNMFTLSNLKFLNLVLNRQDMIKATTVSAVSTIPVFIHFITAFWIFINLAGTVLFIDIINSNFKPFIIKKIFLSGINIFILTALIIFVFFLAFLIINAILLFPAFFLLPLPEISFSLVFRILLVLLCVSSLTVFIAMLFKNSSAACITTSVFSIIGLFLSGGVIPRDFFSPFFKNFSYITLNYWLYESVIGVYSGKSLAVPVTLLFTILFFLLSVLLFFTKINSKS